MRFHKFLSQTEYFDCKRATNLNLLQEITNTIDLKLHVSIK